VSAGAAVGVPLESTEADLAGGVTVRGLLGEFALPVDADLSLITAVIVVTLGGRIVGARPVAAAQFIGPAPSKTVDE